MVDRMITNFHTPKSTLMMMVSAFADRKLIKSIQGSYAKKIQIFELWRCYDYSIVYTK